MLAWHKDRQTQGEDAGSAAQQWFPLQGPLGSSETIEFPGAGSPETLIGLARGTVRAAAFPMPWG